MRGLLTRSSRNSGVAYLSFLLAALVGCSEISLAPEPGDYQNDSSLGSEGSETSGSGLAPDEAFSGKTSEIPIEVFFAADISETAKDNFWKVLRLGIGLWGNYGPTEVYVVGVDKKASDDLQQLFCDRREYSEDYCDSLPDDGMEYYREIGLDGQTDPELTRTEAAWVGVPAEGYHMLVFSRPHGLELEDTRGWPAWNDEATILHEYWHVVQSSYVSNSILKEADIEAQGDGTEWDQALYDQRYDEWTSKISSREGPQWFIEGQADFMSYLELDRLVEAGKIGGTSATDYAWEPVMLSKLEAGLENEWDTSESLEDTMSYDLGSWAVAHLLAEHGEDILLEEFYPQLMEYPTWEANFEETFGTTTEEFYSEFEIFLELISGLSEEEAIREAELLLDNYEGVQ